jgi:putative restriction endonuclease
MPNVSFDQLRLNASYSREHLSELWGYRGFQALCRGVVTPASQRCIVLFVTRDKQSSARQYEDRLEGEHLYWEGPADHWGEERIVNSQHQGDEIHLFYRDRHHSDFKYLGEVLFEKISPSLEAPSKFVFRRVSS